MDLCIEACIQEISDKLSENIDNRFELLPNVRRHEADKIVSELNERIKEVKVPCFIDDETDQPKIKTVKVRFYATEGWGGMIIMCDPL